MLAEKQKITALNNTIKKLMLGGVYPSALKILSTLRSTLKNIFWGLPTTKLRTAVRGTKIGGVDGKDIENTYREIYEDLKLLYSSMVEVAENSLSTYQIFESYSSHLRNRAKIFNRKMEEYLTYFSKGAKDVIYDTFLNLDNINKTTTTAEIDIEQGAALLPRTRKGTKAIDVTRVTLTDELVDGKIYSSFINVFNDSFNSIWQASLTGRYEAIVKFPDTPEVNGLYIETSTPIQIAVEYSNDSYNYYPLKSESFFGTRTWVFESIKITNLKFIITGSDVGVKRIKLLTTGFDQSAVLESITYKIPNTKHITSIRSITLNMEKELPNGTSIKAWVRPGDSSNSWLQLTENTPLAISQRKTGTWTIWPIPLENAATSANYLKYYAYNIPIAQILHGQENIIKGDRQVQVDYFNYDWSVHDGSDHIPQLSDWDNRAEIKTAFFTPGMSLSGYAPNIVTNATSSVNASSIRNMLFFDTVTYTNNSSGLNEWLVIGLIDSSAAVGQEILTAHGNYKFTMYVWCPRDLTLHQKKSAVYSATTTGNQTIASFNIFLNDKPLVSSNKSVTNLNSVDVANNKATYEFKAGWNKYQILVYYPGLSNSDIDQSTVDQYSAGLYVTPNPFSFDSTAYKVQATEAYQKKLSEFNLRYNAPLEEKNSWAPVYTTSGTIKALFNYNPADIYYYATFDSKNSPHYPSYTLEYDLRDSLTTAYQDLAFRFELARTSNNTPKLMSYTVLVK